MSKPIYIRKVGNSLALTVSDLAADMGLGEGDRVYATRTEHGFEITPYDPDFDQAVGFARDFIRKYPNAMKKLAE
jgi:antitoxin MazE